MLSVSHFLHRHLLWFLIAAYIIAMVFPGPGLWIRNVSFGEILLSQQKTNISLLMIMLAILMFNAGLGLKISHLKNILQKKYVLLAGLTANMAIPIAYIFAVTILMRLWSDPIDPTHSCGSRIGRSHADRRIVNSLGTKR